MKVRSLRNVLVASLILAVLVGGAIVASQATRTWLTWLMNDHTCRNCNVVLISIDTLRADHLGCYGYPRSTTPNIDAFSRDAVLFRTVISQAPSTLPSHASIFTSLLPSEHGALFATQTPLAQEWTTLAEVIQGAGYRTASFNGSGQVSAQFGLDQGFDLYQEMRGAQFSDVGEEARRWIDQHADEKFFLFLHSYEVHHSYTPSPENLRRFESRYSGSLPRRISKPLLKEINAGRVEISTDDIRHIVNTYDAEIFSMDSAFGNFLDSLRRKGLYDDTVIVFTSDHGEEFGEHGRMGWHSHSLYDELLRVPLLIKLRESIYGGNVVAELVRSIDIAPTVLGILDLEAPAHYSGTSLGEKLVGQDSRELVAVSQQDFKHRPLPISVRTARWKLYDQWLFDLQADPAEQHELLKGHEELRQRLQAIAKQSVKSDGRPKESPTQLDEETREHLRALGYLD